MEGGPAAALVGPAAVGVVTPAPQPELSLVEVHCPVHVRDRDRGPDPAVTETHDSPSWVRPGTRLAPFDHIRRYRSARGRARPPGCSGQALADDSRNLATGRRSGTPRTSPRANRSAAIRHRQSHRLV